MNLRGRVRRLESAILRDAESGDLLRKFAHVSDEKLAEGLLRCPDERGADGSKLADVTNSQLAVALVGEDRAEDLRLVGPLQDALWAMQRQHKDRRLREIGYTDTHQSPEPTERELQAIAAALTKALEGEGDVYERMEQAVRKHELGTADDGRAEPRMERTGYGRLTYEAIIDGIVEQLALMSPELRKAFYDEVRRATSGERGEAGGRAARRGELAVPGHGE